MRISIIGAGNMGRGIATRALAGGNEVQLFDQDEKAARTLAEDLGSAASVGADVSGDIVVLALPYEANAPAIERYRDALAGKVIVDIANPLDWSRSPCARRAYDAS
jgi:8-hydroxy-5-deazaflavin:NADPH oxidoreductase